MSFHNDGDGLSDEKEEGLKSLLTEDNTRLGIGAGWWWIPILGFSVQIKPVDRMQIKWTRRCSLGEECKK